MHCPLGPIISILCGKDAGHQSGEAPDPAVSEEVTVGGGNEAAVGAEAGGITALVLSTDGGGLFFKYGEPGLELDAGGDLLPALVEVTFDLVLAASLPFCCCLHFARRFLNQTYNKIYSAFYKLPLPVNATKRTRFVITLVYCMQENSNINSVFRLVSGKQGHVSWPSSAVHLA